MRKLAIYGTGPGALAAMRAVTGGPAWSRYDEVLFVDDDAAARVPVRARVVGFLGLLREAAVHDVEVAVRLDDPAACDAASERVLDAGLSLADLADGISIDPPERLVPKHPVS